MAQSQPPSSFQPPKPAPAPGQPGKLTGGPTVELTPERIQEVRRLFYDRGYPVMRIDTYPGKDLLASIEQLQDQLREPRTGTLAQSQLDRLRQIPIPTQWGAIAYTARGGNVGVAGRPSRAKAEEEARSDCAKRAGSACDVLTVSANRCVAFAFNLGIAASVKTYLTAAGYGNDPQAARAAAMGDCLDRAKLRENCEVRRVVCADGRADNAPQAKR